MILIFLYSTPNTGQNDINQQINSPQNNY